MMDAKPYSLKIDDIYLTPDSQYAVLRFHCPACSRVAEETVPVFVARQDAAAASLFWECPHCSTYMRLDKNDLKKQVADFYQRRLDGYKKIINHEYVKQYPAHHYQNQKEEPSLSLSKRGKNSIWDTLRTFGLDKEHLKKTWVWSALHPGRSISRFFRAFREIRDENAPERRLQEQYKQLQEQYRKDVLPRLPWYLEDDDAREALAFAHALRPLLFIRFGILFSRSIGDFTASTIMYAKEKLAGFHGTLDYFYIDIVHGCCNYAFLDIISRTINISPVVPQLFHMEYMAQTLASKWQPRKKGDATLWQSLFDRCFTREHSISPHCFYMIRAYDNHSLDDRIDFQLSFTEQERELAQKELAAMGIPAGSKIVCLHVRDGAYYGKSDGASIERRNIDINLYRKATEYLASSGYFVLRTGAKVAAPLQWESARIIDYATKYRSEFMDIWLFANADLTLASGSGPDVIPYILGRHVIIANHASLRFLVYLSNRNASILPAYAKNNAGRIALREFMAHPLSHVNDSHNFKKKGFFVEYASREEILDAVKEKIDNINGGKLSDGDMWLQKLFRTLLKKNAQEYGAQSNIFPYEKEANYGPLKGLVSSVYLRQYRDELEAGKEDWE